MPRRKATKAGASKESVSGGRIYDGLSVPQATKLEGLIEQGRTHKRLAESRGTIGVSLWKDGSFTIARLRVPVSNGKPGRPRVVEMVGVAKLNCNDDEDDVQRGIAVAVARAAKGRAVAL